MFEWSEELKMVRDAVRTFVDTEIRPYREELEHGDLPPYDLLRKLYSTFGMDQLARDSFKKRIEAEKLTAAGGQVSDGDGESRSGGGDQGKERVLSVPGGHRRTERDTERFRASRAVQRLSHGYL